MFDGSLPITFGTVLGYFGPIVLALLLWAVFAYCFVRFSSFVLGAIIIAVLINLIVSLGSGIMEGEEILFRPHLFFIGVLVVLHVVAFIVAPFKFFSVMKNTPTLGGLHAREMERQTMDEEVEHIRHTLTSKFMELSETERDKIMFFLARKIVTHRILKSSSVYVNLLGGVALWGSALLLAGSLIWAIYKGITDFSFIDLYPLFFSGCLLVLSFQLVSFWGSIATCVAYVVVKVRRIMSP